MNFKRFAAAAGMVIILSGCGYFGLGSDPAPPPAEGQEAGSTPAPVLAPTATLSPDGTFEPGSPRDAAPANGLPPTYTPAAVELRSGVPQESPAAVQPAVIDENSRTHNVAEGETLGTIAEAYGISLNDLLAANQGRIDDIDLLYVGQVLIIPDP